MRSRSRRRNRRWVWSTVGRGCRGRWRASPDRGSATVWTVGAIAVLCAVFGAVLSMGQAVVVRHRAAGAADLAALAAADHWSDGGTAACARADRVARAQGARLVRCAVEGQILDVTASSGTGPITAEVRSRAGPPGSPGSDGSPGPVETVGPKGSSEPSGRPALTPPNPAPGRHAPDVHPFSPDASDFHSSGPPPPRMPP
ncbi:Rv3654c family TadE-like protein [Streptomyces sp. NBC_00386]|uniref:Rv3654c family TadE-like protein n=1 Tax=Streptomyces sp. NBC_00386 TaxID=2975734 RepID=UPI003FCE4E3A